MRPQPCVQLLNLLDTPCKQIQRVARACLGIAVKDVGGDVHGALVGVDGEAGEVLVGVHVQAVVAHLKEISQHDQIIS